MAEGDELIAVCPIRPDEMMLLVSEKGYGKRTKYDNFSPHNRGTGGQRAYAVNSKTGLLVSALSIHKKDSCIGISSQGKALRFAVDQVSIMGRNASGVKVLNMSDDDSLIGVVRQPDGNNVDVGEEKKQTRYRKSINFCAPRCSRGERDK